MLRSLFTAATGAGSQQFNIDVIANNVSNVNTTLRNFGLHECLETACTYTSKPFMHILSWQTSVKLMHDFMTKSCGRLVYHLQNSTYWPLTG